LLWRQCGFTATEALTLTDDITVGLGHAIILRVHGFAVDQYAFGRCPGLLPPAGPDSEDLMWLSEVFGVNQPRLLPVRWLRTGLPDDRILAFWHAGIPLHEAITGQYADDSVDLLSALNSSRCPILHPKAG